MTGVVDYGVGNLFSLECSLNALGEDTIITGDADAICACERVILPGVGAFGDAADKLRATGLADAVKAFARTGKPLMGICLGMQLLFETSFEYGEHKGLGLLSGDIVPLRRVIPSDLRVPHIGWNALIPVRAHPILKYVRAGDCVYFVHGYCAVNCADSLIAYAEYGADVAAVAASGNVIGCQFHPEKSGSVGLKILKAFAEM